MGIHQSQQLEVAGCHGLALYDGGGSAVLCGAEGGVVLPLGTQPLHVDLLDAQLWLHGEAGGLRQQLPVFKDERIAAIDDILRRLAEAATAIDVAAHHAGALLGQQGEQIVVLAYQLVGGREVQDDVGTGQGQVVARRQRCPHVFANLDAEAGTVAGAEHLRLSRHTHRTASQIDLLGLQVGGRGKPALLVELVVVGQVGLGHQSQQAPMLHHGGTVVEQRADAHGQAHHHDDVELAGEVEQHQQALLGLVEQQLLAEQVLTAVARERQLGEDDDLGALALGLCNLTLYLLNVVFHVSHANTWYGSGHFYQSVFHFVTIRLRLKNNMCLKHCIT